MAYDRLDRDIAGALSALADGDLAKAHELLCHAQDLVHELNGMLDVDAWEHGPSLAAIYRYVIVRLTEANMTKLASPATEARNLLAELGDAFRHGKRRRHPRRSLPRCSPRRSPKAPTVVCRCRRDDRGRAPTRADTSAPIGASRVARRSRRLRRRRSRRRRAYLDAVASGASDAEPPAPFAVPTGLPPAPDAVRSDDRRRCTRRRWPFSPSTRTFPTGSNGHVPGIAIAPPIDVDRDVRARSSVVRRP